MANGNLVALLILLTLGGCSKTTPACGDKRSLDLLDAAADQAKDSAVLAGYSGVMKELSTRFINIRTIKHHQDVDSYACEAKFEVLSGSEIRVSDAFSYEIYSIENSEHPVEIRYNNLALTSNLAFAAKVVRHEAEEEAAKEAAREAQNRHQDLLSSLPPDTPGIPEKLDQMATQAAEGIGNVKTQETGISVSYYFSSDRLPPGSGEPGFAKSYPEWRIDCEWQGGALQCISLARDLSWKQCDGSLDPSCDESKDGWVRTTVTEADLKSILPFLTVQDTVAAVRFGYCSNGICFKNANPVGLIQPQMQEWLRNRCGAQLSAVCVE